jgi:hypothetical protein
MAAADVSEQALVQFEMQRQIALKPPSVRNSLAAFECRFVKLSSCRWGNWMLRNTCVYMRRLLPAGQRETIAGIQAWQRLALQSGIDERLAW